MRDETPRLATLKYIKKNHTCLVYYYQLFKKKIALLKN